MEDQSIIKMERKRWVFFGLPFTFTKYKVKQDVLSIESGFFTKVENDCYLYKIQDVELFRGFFERWFGLGTVVCYTGDTTHPKLELKHIKHSADIKNYLLKTSEEARIRRRTVSMLDIGTGVMEDITDVDI